MYKSVVFLMAILAILGTLPTTSGLEESYSYCINSTHKTWKQIVNISGTVETYEDIMNCTYGCLNGKCLPAQTESHDLALVIGIMLVAFFFIYAGLKIDKETHGIIQILFMFVGVMFVIINFAVLTELADYSSITPLETAVDNGYQLAIYVFWFLLFYFMVLFFYKVLVGIGKIQPLKWSL